MIDQLIIVYRELAAIDYPPDGLFVGHAIYCCLIAAKPIPHSVNVNLATVQ